MKEVRLMVLVEVPDNITAECVNRHINDFLKAGLDNAEELLAKNKYDAGWEDLSDEEIADLQEALTLKINHPCAIPQGHW